MGQKCNLLIKSFIKCKLFCKNYKKRILKNCKEAAISVKKSLPKGRHRLLKLNLLKEGSK